MDKINNGIISKPRDPRDYVKGVSSPIPYLVRLDTGNWYPYLSQKQSQKYANWETNDCWCLSGINDLETQCNFLKSKGQFPQEALDFFTSNGYFDANGLFDFSERFIGIISGAKDNGNDPIELWRLSRLNGVLPRSDLAYTDALGAQFGSQTAFANDYYNPACISTAMRQKALQSLMYIDIAYEWLGEEWVQPDIIDMQATLYQSPLHICIPVNMATWNSGHVIYDGSKDVQHAVLNYFIETDGTYDFRDQYNPYDKTLSPDYYIPLVIHGVVTPILQPPFVPPVTAQQYPQTIWSKYVWPAVYNWFRNQK